MGRAPKRIVVGARPGVNVRAPSAVARLPLRDRRRPGIAPRSSPATPPAPHALQHSWHLIVQFALKDFKIRYTHSVLGYAWSVLNRSSSSLIYYFVFSIFIRFDVPNYPGFLLLGIVLWNFFSEGTTNGVASLLARGAILTKVAMPRQVVVYAAVLNALLTFAINLRHPAVLLWITGTPARSCRPRPSRCCCSISSLLTLGVVAVPRAAPRALPRHRLPLGHRAADRLLAHADHLPRLDDPGALALARDLQPGGAHHPRQPPGRHLRLVARPRRGAARRHSSPSSSSWAAGRCSTACRRGWSSTSDR